MFIQKLNKRAFTLAEVLITLTMIGVLAAFTVPSLVNNIGDQQNKVAWKKAFSTISQATQMVLSENGGNLKGAFSNNSMIADSYAKYLNYIKYCTEGQTLVNCWHSNAGEAKRADGIPITNWPTNGSGLVMNNGFYVLFWLESSNCTATVDSGTIPRCGGIDVDINGPKAPNTVGKDIFQMHLRENMLSPRGTTGDQSVNDCNSNGGWGCAAKYLYQ